MFVFKQEYFRHDLVQMYNNYKMFTMGEETIQVPAMGYVEGISCGAVYFGADDPMYSGVGVIAGKHYVGYKGLKDLKKKIQYYQTHPKQLEKIQKAGYEYITKNFTKKKVADNLIKSMKAEVKTK